MNPEAFPGANGPLKPRLSAAQRSALQRLRIKWALEPEEEREVSRYLRGPQTSALYDRLSETASAVVDELTGMRSHPAAGKYSISLRHRTEATNPRDMSSESPFEGLHVGQRVRVDDGEPGIGVIVGFYQTPPEEGDEDWDDVEDDAFGTEDEDIYSMSHIIIKRKGKIVRALEMEVEPLTLKAEAAVFPARQQFVIEIPEGFVRGFSQGSVLLSQAVPGARRFDSRDTAQKFIDAFADKGYGLDSATATIRALNQEGRMAEDWAGFGKLDDLIQKVANGADPKKLLTESAVPDWLYRGANVQDIRDNNFFGKVVNWEPPQLRSRGRLGAMGMGWDILVEWENGKRTWHDAGDLHWIGAKATEGRLRQEAPWNRAPQPSPQRIHDNERSGSSGGGAAPADEGVPNLDDSMTVSELMEFWKHHHQGRNSRELFPQGGPGTKRATASLALYASNKATAMRQRANGDVSTAKMYEDICDRIYDGLPTFARW